MLALFSNTTGSDNTANGFGALSSNTTGDRNTATGNEALRFNNTGFLNTANGYQALFEQHRQRQHCLGIFGRV